MAITKPLNPLPALKTENFDVRKIVSNNGGIVGVSDHGGWAVLVTAARDGTLLDRRRVELVDEGLPKIPHHCEAQGLPIEVRWRW